MKVTKHKSNNIEARRLPGRTIAQRLALIASVVPTLGDARAGVVGDGAGMRFVGNGCVVGVELMPEGECRIVHTTPKHRTETIKSDRDTAGYLIRTLG